MTNFANAPWPSFSDDEISAVSAVLKSNKVNYWTGTEGRKFETEYADLVGRKKAIALHNGTLALELALMTFGIGAGDEVITTPRTFIASASAAVMRGAVPVFADIDPDSQNITAATIEQVITPRTRAIIPVHLGGWPCEMDALMEVAARHNLVVIEDCAQAHGAFYKGRPVGSYGHAAAFSFCQDKIITTGGEGGMLLLDDEEAWARAWSYKDHGKSYEAVYHREHAPGFRWLHESFGTNWRMLEMQAVIGRQQLAKLAEWQSLRQRNAEILRLGLEDLAALRVPWPGEDEQHAFYRFYAFIRQEELKEGWNRDRVMAEIAARGVPCSVGSCSEIYLEKAFDAPGLRPAKRLPVAQALGETSLAFLVHPTLTEDMMHAKTGIIREILRAASQ